MSTAQTARSCLVTGGAGFIGSHVARHLADQGHRVVVVDDLSGGFRDHLDSRCSFVEGDVSDPEVVEALFREHSFQDVFHLAAYAAEGLSHFIKRFNYTNNVIGSVNLINAAVNHDVDCFVFTSSIAVYGAAQTPMTEDTVPLPEDPYGIAKYSVERDLAVTHEMFGLDYVVFRPHNVYGPAQNIGDRYRNVIGIFMNRAMQGEALPVFGDGEQSRAFTYIDDVAPIIASAPDVPAARNQVFNIGTDEVETVNTLAQLVSDAMGVPTRIAHHEARNEVKHAFSDHSKLARVFGERPPTPLAEGVGRMAEWAKRVGPRASKRFEGIEIERKLPPSWRDRTA